MKNKIHLDEPYLPLTFIIIDILKETGELTDLADFKSRMREITARQCFQRLNALSKAANNADGTPKKKYKNLTTLQDAFNQSREPIPVVGSDYISIVSQTWPGVVRRSHRKVEASECPQIILRRHARAGVDLEKPNSEAQMIMGIYSEFNYNPSDARVEFRTLVGTILNGDKKYVSVSEMTGLIQLIIHTDSAKWRSNPEP